MSSRFFADTPIEGRCVELIDAEASHLTKVMRAKVGDEVTLFDGTGAEYTARIDRAGRSKVELSVLERNEVDRELPHSLELVVALPKGDRQRWLVEKAVELGVTRLIPLNTTRGVAQPVEKARQRMKRAVIEASKQCGRNRLMEITPPTNVQWIASGVSCDMTCLIAHPDPAANSLRTVLGSVAPGPILIAIGPEGGFTEEEIALASQRCHLVTLGPRILRIETAALALAATAGLWLSSSQ